MRSRTSNLLIRSQLLYPIELRMHEGAEAMGLMKVEQAFFGFIDLIFALTKSVERLSQL